MVKIVFTDTQIRGLYALLGLVAQLLTALFAWQTIKVYKRQSSSTNRVKFKIRYGFVVAKKDNRNIVNLKIDIVNLGLASVYIEEWGLIIHKPFKRSVSHILGQEFDESKLDPGKPYSRSFPYSHTTIKDKIGRCSHEKVKMSIYIKYHLGEVHHSKKVKFTVFDFQYSRVKESVDEINAEIQDIQTEIK